MSPFRFVLALTVGLTAPTIARAAAEDFWPQWRGPLGNGAAPQADPPLTWSETNNIKWKVAIPGEGDATPIVWGDRIFVLSAVAVGKEPAASGKEEASRGTFQFTVFCLDRASGKVRWQQVAREVSPHEGRQENNTFASASPVTDGKFVWAFFGSRGLHCYDLDGHHKWEKDFGLMKTRMGFGEGASPAISGDILVVYWDHEGDDDFIAAFDKKTGKELWRQPRNEPTGWSTPYIVEFNGQKQVVVNATGKVRSYDLATGKELWSCGGQTANAIPTPVSKGDVVYVTSGFRGAALQAIRLGRTGDLTGTDAIVWTRNKSTPYVPSPLLAGDYLYLISGNEGMLSCFDAKAGEPYFERERLEAIRGVYASPVSAADRIYVLGREGVCVVLRKGPKPEVLAVNTLADSRSDASIAVVGKELFLRTAHNLYCISEHR